MIKIIARCGWSCGAQAAKGAPRHVHGTRNQAHSTSLHGELLRHKDGNCLLEGAKGKASALKFRKKDRK